MFTSVYDTVDSASVSGIEQPKRPQLEAVEVKPQGVTKMDMTPTSNGQPRQMATGTTASEGGGFSGFMSSYGGMIGSAASSIGAAIPKKNEFMNEGYSDPVQENTEARNNAVGQAKDTVASVFGPWAQAFRGIEKLGNAAGEGIGGESGAVIGGLFSGDQAIMEQNADPDISIQNKIFGTLFSPLASVNSYKAKKKRKQAFMIAKQERQAAVDVEKRERIQRMDLGLQQIASAKELASQQLGLNPGLNSIY